MRVIRLTYRLHGLTIGVGEPPGVRIRTVDAADDRAAIIGMMEFAQIYDEPRPIARGVLAELVSRPGRAVAAWLATVDGTPAGLVTLVAADSGAAIRHSIAWLFVAGPFQRRGVGRALVAVAIDRAVAAGACEVWVETRSDWLRAMAFWEAVGFRPVT